MRFVLDCNVLVSAVRTQGVCRETIITVLRDHQVVLSDDIAGEYRTVAGRLAHAPYRKAFGVLIQELERVAVFVEPADVIFGLTDSDDEVYLQTATAAGAALITGNRRDFTERRYGSVDVFSPRMFLEQRPQLAMPSRQG